MLSRRFEDADLLIINVDGIHFGDPCVIGAVGVDDKGNKHVLGIQEGGTENAAAAVECSADLRYHSSFVTKTEALAAHYAALEICATLAKVLKKTTARAEIVPLRLNTNEQDSFDGLVMHFHRQRLSRQ